jgi:hypothetical protein
VACETADALRRRKIHGRLSTRILSFVLLVAHRWPMRTRHPSGSGTDASPAKERRHRPSAHSSPRKSSVPAAAQGNHIPPGLATKRRPSPLVIRRRGASSQQPCIEAMPGRIIIRVVLHQSAIRSTQAGRTVATRTGAQVRRAPDRAKRRSKLVRAYAQAPSPPATHGVDAACVRKSVSLPVGCESRSAPPP